MPNSNTCTELLHMHTYAYYLYILRKALDERFQRPQLPSTSILFFIFYPTSLKMTYQDGWEYRPCRASTTMVPMYRDPLYCRCMYLSKNKLCPAYVYDVVVVPAKLCAQRELTATTTAVNCCLLYFSVKSVSVTSFGYKRCTLGSCSGQTHTYQ